MRRGGKGRRESDKTPAGEDHLFYETSTGETIQVYMLSARIHTNKLSVVTETYINNVAERNRMQILPYIRVYRGLALSEEPLSFSAFPLRLDAHTIS